MLILSDVKNDVSIYASFRILYGVLKYPLEVAIWRLVFYKVYL